MRHTDLRLLALCLKAAGTSFRISGLWPRAIWNSPCPIEVVKSLASYTTQLGFWNIRDVPKANLGRVQKATDVFVLPSLVMALREDAWTSSCPMEVAKLLAPYTTQLGFRNVTAWSRDVSEPKLGRVQKAVSFLFGVALSSHCVVCFFCPPCRQRESAFIIGELFFCHRMSAGLPTSCEQRRLRTRQVHLFVRSPYFAAVCLSQSKKRGRWLE